MIDVETRDRKSLRATHDSLRVLLRLVEKHNGVRPMIYSGYSDVCGDAFPDYDFYIGRYGKKPPVRKGVATTSGSSPKRGRSTDSAARSICGDSIPTPMSMRC